MNERRLIILFFIYLVLEGALRKWLFPGLGTPLYLVKNVLMALIFVVFLGKRIMHRSTHVQPLRLLRSELLMLSGLVFFSCGSVLVTGFTQTALIGLSYYLIMLPLVIVVPRILKDTADLEQLLLKYLWIAIPVFLLGILQFNSPSDAFINRYAWNNAEFSVATFGENRARITGTFSYITPYTYYLQFMSMVALGLLVLSKNEKYRIALTLTWFLIFINIVMTGSRAPFLVSALCSLPFATRFLRVLRQKRGAMSFVMMAGLLVGFLYLAADVVEILSERNKLARDSSARVSGAFYAPLVTLQNIGIVGKGVGSTFAGVRESGGSEEQEFDEVTVDRLGLELGIFGYLLVLGFKLLFLVNAWKLYRSATDPNISVWALVVFCTQLTTLWGLPLYSAVAAAYYFGSIGLYFFLRNEQARLDTIRRFSLAAGQPA